MQLDGSADGNHGKHEHDHGNVVTEIVRLAQLCHKLQDCDCYTRLESAANDEKQHGHLDEGLESMRSS